MIFDRVVAVFVWLIGDVTIFTGVRTGAGMDARNFFLQFWIHFMLVYKCVQGQLPSININDFMAVGSFGPPLNTRVHPKAQY